MEENVNLLIHLLREGQTSAANVMARKPYDRSADRVGLFQMLSSANFSAYSRLRDVEENAPQETQDALRRSYLPVVGESEWQEARGITRNRVPVHSHRWVTFVPVAQRDGLAVPDNDSPREELSTFTDIG